MFYSDLPGLSPGLVIVNTLGYNFTNTHLIVSPAGSGNSSLPGIMGGLGVATSGSMVIDGVDISRISASHILIFPYLIMDQTAQF